MPNFESDNSEPEYLPEHTEQQLHVIEEYGKTLFAEVVEVDSADEMYTPTRRSNTAWIKSDATIDLDCAR